MGMFLSAIASRLSLGPTQSPGDLSPGLKLLGREADQSPSSSAEIKNAYCCNSTPPISIQDVVLS
jgi:hypothetical protein